MKIFTLLLGLLLSQVVTAQWNEQNSGISNQLTDVRFRNDMEGLAIGTYKIMKTTDGGSNWSTSYTCNYFLEAIEFTQNRTYVIGHNAQIGESIILFSSDNGTSWSELTLPQAGILNDICFVTDLIGYTMGTEGTLLKTVDGGISWNAHGTGVSSMIQALYFHDANHGFAAGGFSGGYLFETTDGGLTWTEISVSATSFLQSITFTNVDIGYAVGWDGDIFKTVDGGANWSQQTPVQVYGNMDVQFTENNIGYIVGGSSNSAEIQKTIDGGVNWFSQSPAVNQGLVAVHFPSSGVGYAVGAAGTIVKTSNAGGVSLSELDLNSNKVTIFPNPCENSFELRMSSNELSIDDIEIISDAGAVVYRQSFSKGEKIDVSELESGVYLVKITMGGKVAVKKLYKR
ncbi:MAG: T9SS type A sorting domain-containing protein [Flavobacteriales bacterium]|nr:T9SS type A sorting domain-containing protein [Flavobacteriales bacterium]